MQVSPKGTAAARIAAVRNEVIAPRLPAPNKPQGAGKTMQPSAPKMSLYEAILFDFDGVLVDSEPLHYECWMQVLQPLGIQLDWSVYRRYCIWNSGPPDCRVPLCAKSSVGGCEAAWALVTPGRANSYASACSGNPVLPVSVVDLIKSLYDYRLGVVTASARSEIEPVLERAGIRSCFGTLVCGEDVAHPKPAPEPYCGSKAAWRCQGPRRGGFRRRGRERQSCGFRCPSGLGSY